VIVSFDIQAAVAPAANLEVPSLATLLSHSTCHSHRHVGEGRLTQDVPLISRCFCDSQASHWVIWDDPSSVSSQMDSFIKDGLSKDADRRVTPQSKL
jgi:hypothetical protein